MSDAIDAYLDRLAAHLHPAGDRLRRLLGESESHLRESAASLRGGGLDEQAAAREAIARFGPVESVAEAMRPSLSRLVRESLRMIWLLCGLGAVAVGASGVLAWLLRATAGPRFVAGDSLGTTYTPTRCADFFEYFPHAGSCGAAAALHHADEVVSTRILAGVLGVVLLGGYAWYRRGRPRDDEALPAAAAPMVAAVLFGAASGLLLLDSLALAAGELTHGEPAAGIGDPLSAGLVALIAAALATVATTRRLSGRPRGL